jgi:aminocarboxymuconate-semialdehyde decarboxylase
MPAPIDIHAHFYPEELITLWREEGPRCGGEVADVEGKGVVLKAGPIATNPLGPRFSDLDARLEAMDEQGVAVHALSLSLPMVYWADKALAQKLSECYNDAAATAFLRHPDRLVGLAMLPMHFPAAALAELSARARCPACAASTWPPRSPAASSPTRRSSRSTRRSRRPGCRSSCTRTA